jgi:hypothetical protein
VEEVGEDERGAEEEEREEPSVPDVKNFVHRAFLLNWLSRRESCRL